MEIPSMSTQYFVYSKDEIGVGLEHSTTEIPEEFHRIVEYFLTSICLDNVEYIYGIQPLIPTT
jgi:hypothetical protein